MIKEKPINAIGTSVESAASSSITPQITIFDAAHIIDRSTYREPTLPPAGMRHVIAEHR